LLILLVLGYGVLAVQSIYKKMNFNIALMATHQAALGKTMTGLLCRIGEFCRALEQDGKVDRLLLLYGLTALAALPHPQRRYPVIPSDGPQKYTSSPVDFLQLSNVCLFENKVYMSAEQIPRSDPCDFCFCFKGDVICLQQSCPPPVQGCKEEKKPGQCCPNYKCPVVKTTVPTALSEGCVVDGILYDVGQEIGPASPPCMNCM
jgi:hypothetical protein